MHQPETLEHWAVIKPDAVALHEAERQLTWGEWNAGADRLARSLLALGLTSEHVLAVRSHVRIEWCLVASAAAKIGCPLLCLNWRLTNVETAQILANSRARMVICDDDDATTLAGAWALLPEVTAISINGACRGFLAFSDLLVGEAEPMFSAKGPRFIIYTSGTTGQPKGVLNEQPTPGREHLAQEYLADVTAKGNQRPGDVVLACLPVHHGAGANTIHKAVEFGNTIVLMRRYEPEHALALIEHHRVSFCFAVPTMFKRMAALPAATIARYDRSSIRAILTGGAPVSVALKHWVAGTFGSCVTEIYGSTESSLITAATPDLQRLKPASSGLPYRHVAVSIRDEEGQPLAAGGVGEIWVRTPFCFTGYLGDPPPGPDVLDAEGFFRIGDAGYLDEDGFLFITDRVKDMIISGGVNIYPAEIEAVLIAHPAVQDAAVIGIPNDEFGEEVRGYVELKPGVFVREAELILFAGEQLASYKRPRTLVVVDELPRNTMGKVLKRELREPFWLGQSRRV
jgi:long-chain acyl-CoA synthetase